MKNTLKVTDFLSVIGKIQPQLQVYNISYQPFSSILILTMPNALQFNNTLSIFKKYSLHVLICGLIYGNNNYFFWSFSYRNNGFADEVIHCTSIKNNI